MSDLVATWQVSLPDGKHVVEFEHGTTTGKRIIRLDGKEIFREDWMFKLVGKQYFRVGKESKGGKGHNCCISIDACSGFAYEYTLDVDGKPLKKFRENQNRIQQCWQFPRREDEFRVVLEKNTLDVWVNGKRVETTGEFTDEGTETHFAIIMTNGEAENCCIQTTSSGKRRDGMIYKLFVGIQEMPPYKD